MGGGGTLHVQLEVNKSEMSQVNCDGDEEICDLWLLFRKLKMEQPSSYGSTMNARRKCGAELMSVCSCMSVILCTF